MLFAQTNSHNTTERPAAQAPHMQIKGKYEATLHDSLLRNALHNFCKAKTMQLFGLLTLESLGPGIVIVMT